jgi:mRNA interferase MazF
MKRGDVVLIDFPFSDRTGSKLRPAVVIQADSLNLQRHDTVLLAISRTQRFADTEILIDVSSLSGQQSGLRHNSVIDCANLTTLDQNLVHHTLGTISPELMDRVETALRTIFAL